MGDFSATPQYKLIYRGKCVLVSKLKRNIEIFADHAICKLDNFH